MKKAILYFSLVMTTLFTANHAVAQCTAQIGVNTPSIQSDYPNPAWLILSGFGVNSADGASAWGEFKKNNQPWVALQDATLPRCTGWISLYQISTATFHFGDVFRFHVKMFDNGVLMESSTVVYRVRKCRSNDPRDIQDGLRLANQTNVMEYLQQQKDINIHVEGAGPRIKDFSNLTFGDLPSVVAINDDIALERISDEELLDIDTKPSIQDVSVTSAHQMISFKSADPTMRYSYTIYDLSGKRIFFDTVVGSTDISILSVVPGVYIVVLIDEESKQSISRKIPIQF